MAPRTVAPHLHMDRRRFLAGVGAAAAVGSVGAMGLSGPAKAANGTGPVFPPQSGPNPIPQVIDTTVPGGDPAPDPFHFIHWLLPGPEGATTQILELPAFGLDVDPSQITDFDGFVAYAVVAGTATGGDGELYDTELDVRVMQGRYVGQDGRTHHGTFGFF